MEKFVTPLLLLLSHLVHSQNIQHQKLVSDTFKRYTYLLEVETNRGKVPYNFAMAVKVKGQNNLLTCLHLFYQTAEPGFHFSNYFVKSINGQEIDPKLNYNKRPINFYYYRNNGFDTVSKCKVIAVDIEHDLALVDLPKSLKLRKEEGVDFFDITSGKIDSLIDDCRLAYIQASENDFTFNHSYLTTDLGQQNFSSCASHKIIEEISHIGIPNTIKAKGIKVSNSAVKHGYSGSPVFSATSNKLIGVIWGGDREYENVAMIPDYNNFKSLLSIEDSIKLVNAYINSNKSIYSKSLIKFQDEESMENLRWFFPFPLLRRNGNADIDQNNISSYLDIVKASIIYSCDFFNASLYPERPSVKEKRLHYFALKYAYLEKDCKTPEERDMVKRFNGKFPITVAFVKLNDYLNFMLTDTASKADNHKCDTFYILHKELKDALNDKENYRNEERAASKFYGFDMEDYLSRITKYINVRCRNEHIDTTNTCEEVKKRIMSLSKTNKRDSLRLAYFEACHKCNEDSLCIEGKKLDNSVDCDDLINQAINFAKPFLGIFYSDKAANFIMPNANVDLPSVKKEKGQRLFIFKLSISKDPGQARANALVNNYTIGQPSLGAGNKIFDVLNDFLNGLTEILKPILVNKDQNLAIVGQADGIPYTKEFKPDLSLGDLSDEWVYRVDNSGSVKDSVKFSYLIRRNASPEEKNYALAFERAFEFKSKLAIKTELRFQIPFNNTTHAKIVYDIGADFRGVGLQFNFKLKDCI